MAEKPYIAARLRNPSEMDLVPKAKPKSDILGGIFAILSFLVAVVTLFVLYTDWDGFTKYIDK